MKIRIKIQGALIFLSLGIILIFSNSALIFRHYGILDLALNVTGMVLIFFGFLFRITARGYKEEKSSDGRTLVIDGPYAMIRNPMYFGTFMIGAGIIMMLLRLWFLFLFMIVFLLIYIPQMKKEETALLDRFGEEYKRYCGITPKYFPRLDYLSRLNRYITLKSSWIRKEIVSIMAVGAMIILVEIWEYVRLSWHK